MELHHCPKIGIAKLLNLFWRDSLLGADAAGNTLRIAVMCHSLLLRLRMIVVHILRVAPQADGVPD